MSIKGNLKYSVNSILERLHEGSAASRHNRKYLLRAWVNALIKLRCGVYQIHSLQTHHIQTVINYWRSQGLSSSTLKSRVSALRYLLRKINKEKILPVNKALAIPARQQTTLTNRALLNPDFSAITDPYIYTSLQLQRVFGLYPDEAIKIRPHQADTKHTLVLQPTWCNNHTIGKQIPITTEQQRYWLEQAKQVAKMPGNSLIPPDRSHYQHRHYYDNVIQAANIKNLNGLRYAYAQARYQELTGWPAPINGGLTASSLTPEQQKIDCNARLALVKEMGYSKAQSLERYLGK